jgi:hypothetical protein
MLALVSLVLSSAVAVLIMLISIVIVAVNG